MKSKYIFVLKRTKLNKKISLLIGIMLVIGNIQSSSQMLGNWDFTNTLVGTNGVFNLVSPASFSPLISTRSFNGGTEYYGENNWPTGGINTAAYMQFSLWPVLGYQMNMTTLTIRMRRSNTGSPAGSGPTGWSVRSSLDGFTNDIASGTMDLNYGNYVVPLPYTFLSLPLPIVFRVYGYNTTVSSGGTNRMVFDNISASGLTAVLPIRLSAFTATAASDNVRLNFTMQQAEVGTKYIIERSTDTRNFSQITTIIEKYDLPASYSFNDYTSLTGTNKLYYRLKMVGIDGSTTYSSILLVNIDGTQIANRFQFSTSGRNLYVNGQFKPEYTIDLFNASGARVSHYNPVTNGQSLVLSLSASLPAGNYVVLVNGTAGRESGLVVVR